MERHVVDFSALRKASPEQAMLLTASGETLQRFDARSVEQLKDRGFSMDEIYRFVAPRRTLARRIEKNEQLTLGETDAAQRILRISELADRVFEEREKAQRWLRKRSRALNGIVPLDLLVSETGARLVEDELFRIEYGIYS
jgi:putative toxin-antitoxin system antitoxin component (TIGR02293 family)